MGAQGHNPALVACLVGRELYDGPPKLKPKPILKPTSTAATPLPQPAADVSQKCSGLNRDKKSRYIIHGAAFRFIVSKFYPELLREAKLYAGYFARIYHKGMPEATELYV
jgi:hypothetical protein